MTPSLTTARLLHAHGVSCIPCNADKTPRIKSWDEYVTTLPTPADLDRWFATDQRIALIAGRVQCLDFDEKYSKGILARYAKRAEDTGLDQLIGGLIQQLTPSGGYHLVWQCDSPRIGNMKLAQKANKETLIETRGEGGYFLISPSAGYQLITGDWSSIPTISEEDRDALLNLARTFDERPPIEAHETKAISSVPGGDTPGDDFDFRADLPALLRKHGWKAASRDNKYWTRPGKSKGISASWDVVPGRFFVFSSSTEFDPEHVYRPWHVYAVLECGKDYAKAAGELRRQGFGGVSPSKSPPSQVMPADWMPPIESAPEQPGVEGINPVGEALTIETREEKLRRLWAARRFDPAVPPPEPRVIFSLNGVAICTPGNLTAIEAQVKVGKSALTQAFVAATLTDADRDCLSVVGYNAAGHAVIYVDSEQAKVDFWRAIERAKKRAGVEAYPDWLAPHCLSDLPVAEIREGLAIKMADEAARCGGIHSVFIDGIADLALDVNDAEECNALVADLFRLATRYDCAIICVIHKNPGSDKTRGHLGSQLARKAETNLTLEKEDNETVVWSVKQRRAPIFKNDGPRFAWSEEYGMHVSVVGSGKPKITQTLLEWQRFAQAAFIGSEELNYTNLVKALERVSDKSEITCSRNIKKMLSANILTYTSSKGLYSITK